jgi:hypothetical protein
MGAITPAAAGLALALACLGGASAHAAHPNGYCVYWHGALLTCSAATPSELGGATDTGNRDQGSGR